MSAPDDFAELEAAITRFIRAQRERGERWAAVENLLDIIGAGIRAIAAQPDDDKILRLFREWVDARRLSWAVHDDDDAGYEAAATVADKIEDAIIATPSSGAVGLAIKTYFLLHIDNRHLEDAAALGHELSWETLEASILRDLIKFVPELAPLVGNAAIDGQP